MTHNGKPWEGPDQYEDATGQLMMLPSDIFLMADPEFKKWVLIYAKDEARFYKDFGKWGWIIMIAGMSDGMHAFHYAYSVVPFGLVLV